jgi:hypothetical protein
MQKEAKTAAKEVTYSNPLDQDDVFENDANQGT